MKTTVIDTKTNKIIGTINSIPAKGDTVIMNMNAYEGIVDMVIHREPYNDVVVYVHKVSYDYITKILQAFGIIK